MTPRYFLGCESLRAGNGGICRVARLVARVLADEQAAGRGRADGVVLSDPAPPPDLGLAVRAVGGSRGRFVAAVNAALLAHTHFLYDCGGMARAHQWLPLPRRPSLAYLHGIEAWRGTAHPAQVAALVRTEHLLSNSRHTRDRAADLDDRFAAATVCWLATEADAPPDATPAPTGPPRVLILGRLDQAAYKGHAELIDCWPRVRAAVPDAVLTVAGSGPAETGYRRRAADRGLPEASVEFRGFVPEAELSRLWAETTVFAMPSRGEGFGLVYIEAMRHRRPVIASVHDAGPEVNLDGQTGYNVDLDRPDELPDRLIRLLRDRDLAARLGQAGHDRWAEHFRYTAFRDRFRPLLAALAAG